MAEDFPLSEADRAMWRALRDPAAPDHPLNDPALFWCEGHALAVGRVPGAPA